MSVLPYLLEISEAIYGRRNTLYKMISANSLRKLSNN